MPPLTLPLRHADVPGPLPSAELLGVLTTAAALRQAAPPHGRWQPLRGCQLALLCARAAWPAADDFSRVVAEVGGSVARLDSEAWRLSAGNEVPEAARMLGRLYDAIDCCDLPAPVVELIDRHAGVPVFNGLARPEHPPRLLAELQTMRQASGRPLNSLRLRIEGDAPAALSSAAEALICSAGVTLLPQRAIRDASPDDADFVLDLSAPAAAGRLRRSHATADEQSSITALLAEYRRAVVQALIVNALR